MKTQKEIEILAKEYAGIPIEKDVDEEERYFQGHACKVYDAFIVGYIAANQHDNFLRRFQQFIDERILLASTDESKAAYVICKQTVLDLYNI